MFRFLILIATLSTLFAQSNVTLVSPASPATGQAGLTTVNVQASGFLAGTVLPSEIDVLLTPAPGSLGPSVQTVPISITSVIGSIRRISFLIPSALSVLSPT